MKLYVSFSLLWYRHYVIEQEDNMMAMMLPDGYLGKGWYPVITDYNSYLKARRFRKWCKGYPDLNFTIEKLVQWSEPPYIIVPSLKWDLQHNIPIPNMEDTFLYDEIYTRVGGEGTFPQRRPPVIKFRYEISSIAKDVCYKDSEGLIGGKYL